MKIGEFLIELVVKATGDEKIKDTEQAMVKLIKVAEKFAKGQASLSEVMKNAIKGFTGGKMAVAGFAVATVGAIVAIDKLGYRLAQTQQRFISFQRQTGLSISTLNKYASASASVSLSATPEGTASSLQRVAQNLFDIRMGRGDISPYQELGFFGGKSINPYGKSVEQVIEELRVALKGVGDIQATNIITRMGFNAEDLLMLRMSREEFEKIQNIYLSPEKQEALNRYGLQMRRIKETFRIWGQEILVYVAPSVSALATSLMNFFKPIVEFLGGLLDTKFGRGAFATAIVVGFHAILFAINPVIGALMTFISLLDVLKTLQIEEEKLGGGIMKNRGFFEYFKDINPIANLLYSGHQFIREKAMNITINTSQPPSMVIKDVELHYGNMAGQLTPKAI